MRTYFGTGLTGFVGRALVRELLKDKNTGKIVLLTRGTRKNLLEDPRIEYLVGDITTVKFPDGPFSDVIHAACDANDLLQPDMPAYYYAIVQGSQRIFEWVMSFADWDKIVNPLPNFLHVSSGAVVHRNTPYAEAKRLAEKLSHECHLYPKTARIYSLVGEEMPLDGQYAIGRFISQALYGEISYYDVGAIRSYLHVEDAARWMLAILNHPQNETYDVGSSEPIAIGELARLIANVCGVKAIEISGDYQKKSGGAIYLPHAERTRKLLGVEETIPLITSIKRVYDYHKNNDHLRNPHLEPSRGIRAGPQTTLPAMRGLLGKR